MIDRLLSSMEIFAKIPAAPNSPSPVAATTLGLFASFGTWALEGIRWYASNMPLITQWIIHIAQIGGIVIMIYTIMILRRNWKTGKDNVKVIKCDE